MKRAVRQGRAQAQTAEGGSVNIAARSQVVVADTLGSPGSAHGVSASQRVRIRQTKGETNEEVEETHATRAE